MLPPQFFEVQVPPGTAFGQAFHANINGTTMLITCPDGVMPGQTVQVQAAATTLPTVTGVPVGPTVRWGQDEEQPIVAGDPVAVGFSSTGHQEIAYIEVEEISPSGWLCLIVGCFACPGLNLLGLCMRERRLVPVSHVGDVWR